MFLFLTVTPTTNEAASDYGSRRRCCRVAEGWQVARWHLFWLAAAAQPAGWTPAHEHQSWCCATCTNHSYHQHTNINYQGLQMLFKTCIQQMQCLDKNVYNQTWCFQFSPFFIRGTHAQTLVLHLSDLWLSCFFALQPLCLEWSPLEHGALYCSLFLQEQVQDISLLRMFQLSSIVLHP